MCRSSVCSLDSVIAYPCHPDARPFYLLFELVALAIGNIVAEVDQELR